MANLIIVDETNKFSSIASAFESITQLITDSKNALANYSCSIMSQEIANLSEYDSGDNPFADNCSEIKLKNVRGYKFIEFVDIKVNRAVSGSYLYKYKQPIAIIDAILTRLTANKNAKNKFHMSIGVSVKGWLPNITEADALYMGNKTFPHYCTGSAIISGSIKELYESYTTIKASMYIMGLDSPYINDEQKERLKDKADESVLFEEDAKWIE